MTRIATTIIFIGVLLLAISPYKIVVSPKFLEVRDLLNLFGWKVDLSNISTVSFRLATNRIEVTYRRKGLDRTRVIRSANPKLLLEKLMLAAPHAKVETI